MKRKDNPSGFPRKSFTGASRRPPPLWSTTPVPYQWENVPEGATSSPTPYPCSQGSSSDLSKKGNRGGPRINAPVLWHTRATVGQLRPRPSIRSVTNLQVMSFPEGETEIPFSNVTPTMTTMASAPAGTGVPGSSGEPSEKNKRPRARPRKHVRLGRFSFAPPTSLGNPPPIASPGGLTVETYTKFSTHVVNVQPGEDVGTKLFQYTKRGKRQLCIFSASGAVSDVKFWRSHGEMVTHEGLYDILSLSASLVSVTHGLYVTLLAGNGVLTIGGAVADILIAASPILIVIATFTLKKPRRNKNREEDHSATATYSTEKERQSLDLNSSPSRQAD